MAHKVKLVPPFINRGARIRTGDPLLPKQVRYRTAPRPEGAETKDFSGRVVASRGAVCINVPFRVTFE